MARRNSLYRKIANNLEEDGLSAEHASNLAREAVRGEGSDNRWQEEKRFESAQMAGRFYSTKKVSILRAR